MDRRRGLSGYLRIVGSYEFENESLSIVTPAKAGVQPLDSRFRGNDGR